MELERWFSSEEHFLFLQRTRVQFLVPHTSAALLLLMVSASLHKGKQLKVDMPFSSLAATDYTHGHNPNPHPPTFSNALDNRKSTVGRPVQVHPPTQ